MDDLDNPLAADNTQQQQLPQQQEGGAVIAPAMAMAQFGRLDEFDNSKEDWTSYIERLRVLFHCEYYT